MPSQNRKTKPPLPKPVASSDRGNKQNKALDIATILVAIGVFTRGTNEGNQVSGPENCAYHALYPMLTVAVDRSEDCESELVASVAAFAARATKQDQVPLKLVTLRP